MNEKTNFYMAKQTKLYGKRIINKVWKIASNSVLSPSGMSWRYRYINNEKQTILLGGYLHTKIQKKKFS
jgi:hypothetical protein